MKAQKKVEIIIEHLYVEKIVTLLRQLEIQGYSIIDNVRGSGEHGIIDADDISGSLTNTYIMTICTQEKMEQLVQALKPHLKKIGGIALVSDVMWIQH